MQKNYSNISYSSVIACTLSVFLVRVSVLCPLIIFTYFCELYLLTTLLMRPWQPLIRVICNHLAHDGQQGSSDLLSLFPSRPSVRQNGSHVSAGLEVNV